MYVYIVHMKISFLPTNTQTIVYTLGPPRALLALLPARGYPGVKLLLIIGGGFANKKQNKNSREWCDPIFLLTLQVFVN